MNGLARQYLPKGTDFDNVTEEYVMMVEEKLNNTSVTRLLADLFPSRSHGR